MSTVAIAIWGCYNSPVTQIYLARHGETEWNAGGRVQGWLDSKLTERGRRQAEALAARLALLPVQAVYVSDLSRALDTAAPIARAHGLVVQTRPGLREKCFGDWEGLTAADLETRYAEEWHRYHVERDLEALVPGGETWPQVQARIVAVLGEALAAHPGREDCVILVGHGGSLRAAVLHALDAPLSILLRLHFSNASLSCLEYKNECDGRVLLLNETSHLEGLGE